MLNDFLVDDFFLSLFQAHHLMSEDDLRRIFQVEHHNDGELSFGSPHFIPKEPILQALCKLVTKLSSESDLQQG